MNTGWSAELLAEGVEIFREIPWTTIGVEQQHGSMAVVHRAHEYLSGTMLSTRAFLHAARLLL